MRERNPKGLNPFFRRIWHVKSYYYSVNDPYKTHPEAEELTSVTTVNNKWFRGNAIIRIAIPVSAEREEKMAIYQSNMHPGSLQRQMRKTNPNRYRTRFPFSLKDYLWLSQLSIVQIGEAGPKHDKKRRNRPKIESACVWERGGDSSTMSEIGNHRKYSSVDSIPGSWWYSKPHSQRKVHSSVMI